jgi:hypothetical protein
MIKFLNYNLSNSIRARTLTSLNHLTEIVEFKPEAVAVFALVT